MVLVVAYHWLSGACTNSSDDGFDAHYAELCLRYGPPALARAGYRRVT